MRRRIARLMIGPAALAVVFIGAAPVVSAATTSPSTAPYAPTGASITLSSSVASYNSTISLSATGLKLDESCTITIDGATIGHAYTGSTGGFSTSVVIPSDIPTGEQTITATCNKGDVVSESIDIEASSVTATPTGPSSSGPSSSSSGGVLATTGTDAAVTVGVGAGAIALGGLLVLGARRRRRSSWTA